MTRIALLSFITLLLGACSSTPQTGHSHNGNHGNHSHSVAHQPNVVYGHVYDPYYSSYGSNYYAYDPFINRYPYRKPRTYSTRYRHHNRVAIQQHNRNNNKIRNNGKYKNHVNQHNRVKQNRSKNTKITQPFKAQKRVIKQRKNYRSNRNVVKKQQRYKQNYRQSYRSRMSQPQRSFRRAGANKFK